MFPWEGKAIINHLDCVLVFIITMYVKLLCAEKDRGVGLVYTLNAKYTFGTFLFAEWLCGVWL